ncbi:MAG: HlyD family efflux transporter periplasmic adaptor subunit [Tannerella sp.]|jgi:HlyD family secretion protein|nr:HlyD family efflux transporter periplasmic adaptor subunit [Tannerella sp.]
MDIQLEQKKGIRRKHVPYLIGGALFLTLLGWIVFGDHSSTLKIDARGVSTGTVTADLFNDFVRVDGQVQPITVVQLSPEEGGIVQEIVIEEGAGVRRGDVIVRLSNSQLDLQILQAEADLAEKQNFLRNTLVTMEQDRLSNQNEKLLLELETMRKKRAFGQQEKLYAERLTAHEDYLQAREDYDLAMQKHALIMERIRQDSILRTTQVEQMEENLANMRRNVLLVRERKAHLDIRSQIDGELGLLDVVLGQNVSPGQKIGQINDLSDYKVEALIDEHYIDRVRTELSAAFERQGARFALVVRKVYPEVRDGKFRTDFIFTGERPDNIRSGQTYYINLELGQPSESIIIPKGTFFQNTGGRWIFVLDPDGKKAHRRSIRIGRQNPQYYEVLEGLSAGEKVILSGYESFGDNQVLVIE